MATSCRVVGRPKWDDAPSIKDWSDLSTKNTSFSIMTIDSFEQNRTVSGFSTYSDNYDGHSSTGPSSPSMIIEKMKQHNSIDGGCSADDDDEAFQKELELMKEKFSKLLLGEDMSGSGKGVCTAVAISNTMTNLFAYVFGQVTKLQPLSPEKKEMWRRETDCLLSICDYIMEPQNNPNGTSEGEEDERPRSDICMNLPALRKLDAMLLEILDSFGKREFWYTEKENTSGHESMGSLSKIIRRNEDKWWLPVPRVPPCGLSEKSQKQLKHQRDSANQMHKAARAINSSILAEMEVPETYILALPKSGRESVGDTFYRYMSTTDQFSPDRLLDCLEIESEHVALDIADRIEASMQVWKRKASLQSTKSSWSVVKDETKNETLASRAESILLCLKHRYPQLSQTALDTSKIQYNKDVGQAILESYSRVLESLAFNLAARIDDVLYVDGLVKNLIH